VSDAGKPRVLCLDDEPRVLEGLRDALRRRFEVVISSNGFEALRLLTEQPYDAVVSDMRMPLLNGARFLTLAREHAPETVRVMLTGHSTLDDAAAAVNEGHIFRLLIKPCKATDLSDTLDAAVDHHRLLVREREIRDQSQQTTMRTLIDLAARVDPDGPARAERIRRQALELATQAAGVAPSWELACACDLMQVGAVALSPETRARLALGTRLSREHATELEQLPELAASLLTPLPALEPITALLRATTTSFVPPRPDTAGTPAAAAVLRIALDFELLERQDVPTASALSALRARRRYDQALVTTLTDLLEVT
jgi:response regulator RpfG family c-di-GMP phosphodiesterase